jgi:hypothetical protein
MPHSEVVESEATSINDNNEKKYSTNNEVLKRSHDDKKHILNENSNHSVKRGLLKKIFRTFSGKRKSRKSDSQGGTIDNVNTAIAASGIDNIKHILSEYEEDNFSVSSESSSSHDALDSSSRKMMIKAQNTTLSSRRMANRRNKSLEPNEQNILTCQISSNLCQSEVKRSSEPTEMQSERCSWGLASIGESSFFLNQSSSTHGKRFSEPTMGYIDRKKFYFKLGIRRALDFTGSSVETYKSAEMCKSDPDQPDELKMMVTLEQMMKAADVSANMQRWETMLLWSSRLFEEQKNCFINGHGPDPEHDWHENQIAFFESYTMPLACRLVDTSVFELEVVEQFVNGVRQNNIRWMVEGMDMVTSMVQKWNSIHTNFS